jgi:SAM-dependent methyltransferase
MRITYRSQGVKSYWTSRWQNIPADAPMENVDAYPLKYAQMAIKDRQGKILEAGCGAGRILRYYHNRGYDIFGLDYIDVAISKLRKVSPALQVTVGDITDLKFADQTFRYILAFGLFHNLEYGLEKAIQETYRVLEKGGVVCSSFRADNIQTRLVDYLAEKGFEYEGNDGKAQSFHKMNLTKKEYQQLFVSAGFAIDFIGPVENMPLLYKFKIFRASGHKIFNENKARKEGYRLSWIGQRLQTFLMRYLPNQFCNIYVLIAHKE